MDFLLLQLHFVEFIEIIIVFMANMDFILEKYSYKM